MTENAKKSDVFNRFAYGFAAMVCLAIATAYIEYKSMSQADGEKIHSVCSESRDLGLEILTIYRTRQEVIK